MNVTVKTLAEACGVSRGTVDRVLHNRGAVKPEVALKVKTLARELGYVPNRAGRALAAYKEPYKIGALLPSVGNAFFEGIVEGMNNANEEFSDLGVKVIMKTLQGYDLKEHLKAIDDLLNQGCKALCLATINTPEISEKIDYCTASGIHVILVNTDVEHAHRLCYVGSDYLKAGKTCAGMLSLIAKDDLLNILIVTGSKLMLGHNLRIKGLQGELSDLNVNYNIVEIVECNDSDILSQQLTSKMLQLHPEINCIYIAGAGVQGVGASLIAHGDPKIIAVAYDDIYATRELVKAGIIKFVVCQQPQRQGYHAIKRAYQALSGLIDKNNSTDFYTDTLIKISSNLKQPPFP